MKHGNGKGLLRPGQENPFDDACRVGRGISVALHWGDDHPQIGGTLDGRAWCVGRSSVGSKPRMGLDAFSVSRVRQAHTVTVRKPDKVLRETVAETTPESAIQHPYSITWTWP